MINYFSKKNSSNIILLLIYLFALKANIFKSNLHPIKNTSDGLLYKYLIIQIQKLQNAQVYFNILLFILLYVQALMVSNIISKQKLLPTANYLAGMCFVLIYSFFPNWNILSSAFFVNIIILIVWQLMNTLQQTNGAKTILFNIGLLLGIANLFYNYAFIYLLLVFLGVLTFRAFKLYEYIVLLLGYAIVYYFLIIWRFLTNSLSWSDYKLTSIFHFPNIENKKLIFVACMLILGLMILGFYTVQKESRKMPIQSRKIWNLMLYWVAISLGVPFLTNNVHFWVYCLLPIATFIGASFYYIKNKKLRAFVHWVLFVFAIYINYFII